MTIDKGHDMRVSAYALLADPTFLRESIAAYYDHVDRIVVCFDRTSTSWTGTPLPVDVCREMVREIDVDGKCVELAGDFSDTARAPLENDTLQRQTALDAASDGADWVLQLDTDEVITDAPDFFASLALADQADADGLDYPSRRLYARISPGRYLEQCRRFGRVAASFPGPLALRPGAHLRLARQADVPLYRVDFDRRGTDPWQPRGVEVHRVIDPDRAVLHFSWVRTPDVILRKFAWSGHAPEIEGPAEYRAWLRRTRHPRIASVLSTFRSSDWLRVAAIPEPPGGDPAEVSGPSAG
ncbi:hypothetical protein [Microbacterium thalassium]|uniref:Glycosyl transferase family 2 n=1 Tax=Microbacterium thalassium TaxID=362649 RepID=A0A7X0FMU5_9MICO|nr:hypothetical protein [Microbacterium thalassium]MBB6389891.1 hypothetical protein [Microbacterium thalassium]GLK24578.1 hypothetical protein GCM10017607_18960 [Microbacterium thalassium]